MKSILHLNKYDHLKKELLKIKQKKGLYKAIELAILDNCPLVVAYTFLDDGSEEIKNNLERLKKYYDCDVI